jgi:hypothetical protein
MRQRLSPSLPARFSDVSWIVGIILIVCIGGRRFLQDGSFWVDEAPIVLSLLNLSLVELFGTIGSDHSFPRLYLVAISAMGSLFGFETAVLRALPFLFFVAGTTLWIRLLYLRLRTLPLFLLAAVVLNLVSMTWPMYSALMKQYTFDVFLALVPFILSDRFFERWLRRGDQLWKGALLTGLCAFSYTYPVALLGRICGWYASEFGRTRRSISPRGAVSFITVLAISLASLWWTDLRHTLSNEQVFNFWSRCAVGNDWEKTWGLVNNFAFGWYGHGARSGPPGLPWLPLLLLKLTFVAGLIHTVRTVRWPVDKDAPTDWGSRSIGCLATLGGLFAASALIQYPLCSGRLTLFVLCFQQIILFEGFCWLNRIFDRFAVGRYLSIALGVAMIGVVVPVALTRTTDFLESGPPQNIRPLLEHMHARSDLPVYVMPCIQPQVMTLPEGLAPSSAVYVKKGTPTPWEQAVWILDIESRFWQCQTSRGILRSKATAWKRVRGPEGAAHLYLARFPKERP